MEKGIAARLFIMKGVWMSPDCYSSLRSRNILSLPVSHSYHTILTCYSSQLIISTLKFTP